MYQNCMKAVFINNWLLITILNNIFNHSLRNSLQYKELAVFHLNIRSLNCNCSGLIELLKLLEISFDMFIGYVDMGTGEGCTFITRFS